MKTVLNFNRMAWDSMLKNYFITFKKKKIFLINHFKIGKYFNEFFQFLYFKFFVLFSYSCCSLVSFFYKNSS